MLTDEQKEVIECSKHLKQNEILKINAFAGTGKTTTLIEITKANENKKYLYLGRKPTNGFFSLCGLKLP